MRAQELGFTLEEIRDLLRLWADSSTSCNVVQRRAGATLARIDEMIADLRRRCIKRWCMLVYVLRLQTR